METEFWHELTDDVKRKIHSKYLIADSSDIILFEKLFGKENLQTYNPLQYIDIAEELFKNKTVYRITINATIQRIDNCEDYSNEINCVSQEQAEKLLAYNKLLNFAKSVNGNWKPDWRNTNERKYFIAVYDAELHIRWIAYNQRQNSIFFKSEKDAIKAIEILGKELILKALSTDY